MTVSSRPTNSQQRKPLRIRAAWFKNENLQEVFRILARAGGEARIAGGAVRNALLKEPVTEVDFATTLPPEQVIEAFRNAGHGVFPTGIDHGTVTVKIGTDLYEITTLRHDLKTDGRRATVAFTDDWAGDAARRDFTINALYLDQNGHLFDYTNGYRDIQTLRVRFVGSPSKRISEDYLRILRFFRFHARYGKGRLHSLSLQACIKHKNGLKKLSAERIRTELLKLMEARRAVDTLKIMAAKNILKTILPGANEPTAETWRVMRRLPADGVLRLALLIEDIPKMKLHLRLSNAEVDRIERIYSAPSLSPALRADEQRRILYRLGAGVWRDSIQIDWAKSRASMQDRAWDKLLKLADRWSPPKFPVNGKDIIARGIAPGPQMGQILQELEDWWIATDFQATRDELLSQIKT